MLNCIRFMLNRIQFMLNCIRFMLNHHVCNWIHGYAVIHIVVNIRMKKNLHVEVSVVLSNVTQLQHGISENPIM